MQRRLKTVDYDDTFFLNEIIDRRNFIPEDELASASQRHIRHCREYFDSVFSKETTDVLLQWEKLLSNASITYFIVENKVDAVQIFAFSNDRGKPLSRLAFPCVRMHVCNGSNAQITPDTPGGYARMGPPRQARAYTYI